MSKKIILYFLIDIVYSVLMIFTKTGIINLGDYNYNAIIYYLKNILQDIILILFIFDIKVFVLKIGLFDKLLKDPLQKEE